MKFHHIGLAVKQIEAEIESYRAIGASDFSPIYDDTVQNVKIIFFMLGGVRHELVSPLSGKSPVDQYLKKNIRIYHTCYEVEDLEKAIDDLEQAGAMLVLPPTKAVALENRKVSFLLIKSGDLIELLECSRES